MTRKQNVIEVLAKLEHEQWAYWAVNLLKDEKVEFDKVTAARWRELIATKYEDLDEEMKEEDRKWARKVLAVLTQNK